MRFETQTNLYGDIPLAERFKALDTQFAITQGHINALISETELRELLNGDKTMYSAMNDIKIDINGLRANLSSLTTEVDGEYGISAINSKLADYEATINGFSANFESIKEVVDHTGYNSYTEAVQAKISDGIEGFNSTIQSTYYTKNDVYTKSEVDSELQGVSGAFTSAISNVQSQIDNKIETWCRDGVPTASNYPASDWTTSAIKDQHIGDLYYDTKNGYAYQYTKQNNNYSWNVITTSGIEDALTIAGNKKRVFVTQPTPPYEIGDLWVQGSSGDIMRCGTARASGNYNSSDWVKASKYTDDSAFNTFKNGQYAQDITTIGAQLDNKVEIHYGTVVPTLNDAPANSWSTSERADHLDDLYYNTSTGYCYRFIISGTTYSWVRIKDSDITSAASVASTAQSIANGKATIFTGSTTPALPRVGDLWLKSANDDILTYVNDTDKWQKYNKYTDDTAANQVASNLADNYSTTSQIRTLINQSANDITLEVSQKYTSNNLICDGELTRQLGNIDNENDNLNPEFTTIANKLCVKFSNDVRRAGNLYFQFSESLQEKYSQYQMQPVNNLILTVSAEVYVNSDVDIGNSGFDFAFSSYPSVIAQSDNLSTGTVVPNVKCDDIKGQGWQKIWFTVKFTNITTCKFRLSIPYFTAGFVAVRNVKVEYGTINTAWSPAAEDTQVDEITGNEIVSRINLEPSSIQIEAKNINLNGFISANQTFTIDENGSLTASDGTIGGWTINAGKISGGDSETGVAVMQKPGGTSGNATWVFAAGGSSHSDYGDCKFRVSKNGDLYAIGNGRISGWNFTQSKIYGGDANTGVAVMQIPTSSTTWVFAAGGNTHDTYGSCPFRVSKSGKLYAKGAELSGDTSITGRLLQSAYGFTAEFGQATLTFSNQNATIYGEIGGMSLTGGKGLVIKGGEAGKNFVGIAASKIRVFVNEGSTVDPTGYYDTISVSFRVITSVSWTGSGIGYTYRVLDFQRGLLVGSHE